MKKEAHYDKFIDSEVTVHTYKSIDGLPKKFTCKLKGYDSEDIILEIKGEVKKVKRSFISKISIDLV